LTRDARDRARCALIFAITRPASVAAARPPTMPPAGFYGTRRYTSVVLVLQSCKQRAPTPNFFLIRLPDDDADEQRTTVTRR